MPEDLKLHQHCCNLVMFRVVLAFFKQHVTATSVFHMRLIKKTFEHRIRIRRGGGRGRCTLQGISKSVKRRYKPVLLLVNCLGLYHIGEGSDDWTPRSGFLLEKTTNPQTVKKPCIYETRRFITTLTRVRHLPTSKTRLIHSKPMRLI